MPVIMLDTSVCVRALRHRQGGLSHRFTLHADDLAVSTVVVAELTFGAILSSRPDHHGEQVGDLLRRMTIMDFDQDAAEHAADVRAYLQRQGQPIGAHDTLIAGHARSCGALLVTGNLAHFRRVPGLLCEDWPASE